MTQVRYIRSLAGLCLGLALSLAPTARGAAGAAPAEFQTMAIPFELMEGLPVVKCGLNGSAPFYATLDSGAYMTVVDESQIKDAGLQSRGSGVGSGAGGRMTTRFMSGATLELDGLRLHLKGSVGVFKFHPDGPRPCHEGPESEANIGAEFFKNLVVELDFERRVMTLRDPKTFVYEGKGVAVPLNIKPDDRFETRVAYTLPGRKPVEGWFLVDTGFNGVILVDHSGVRKQKIEEALPRTLAPANRAVAFGGSPEVLLGRFEEVRVGDFALKAPIALLMHKADIADSDTKDGVLGTGFLRRFKVIFDYARKRMILEPNASYAEPFQMIGAGLSIVAGKPGDGGFRVCGINPSTPAADAGVRPDDIVVEIDGRAASGMTLDEARRLLREEGAVRSVKLRRGGDLIHVSLPVRALL
jgi:hypothetical protein